MAEWIEDSIDFAAYLENTEYVTKLIPASRYRESLKEHIRKRREGKQVYLPWDKTTDNFTFKKGEMTIWAGQNGHGKSLITSQVMLSLIGQGERVCVVSLEMSPEETLLRMARMFTLANPMHPAYRDNLGQVDGLIDEFIDWSGKNLWIYRHKGSVDVESVLGVAVYAAKEKQCTHFFVDNLAKCMRKEDDINEQKAFIDRIFSIGHDHGIHTHVVHHLRKPAKESEKPDKSDVKGSGSIVDQPDNLFLVWRNKAKEEAMQSGDIKKAEEPDCVVYCKKQRNHDGIGVNEPSILLWFEPESLQYVGYKGATPMAFYAPYPHVAV